MSTFWFFHLICLPDKYCIDAVEKWRIFMLRADMLKKREVRCRHRRACCGCPRCYQATTIKQDFTQRWLAFIVLSRYSFNLLFCRFLLDLRTIFTAELWVIWFSFIVEKQFNVRVICCHIKSRKLRRICLSELEKSRQVSSLSWQRAFLINVIVSLSLWWCEST